MPTYETPQGMPLYLNLAYVVMAQPGEVIGETRVLLPITAVSINAQGAGGGLTFVVLKEPFTNVKRDLEAAEKHARRGGLTVVS